MKTLRFKHLVKQHKNQIYNQAYYFTNSKEDAEDISQEVLLKLWHHLNSVKSKAVKSWLARVTRNVCIDFSRKKREYSLNELGSGGQQRMIDCRDEAQADPAQLVISEDLIRQGIASLPETLRTIVIMREIQDLPYALIAETMNLPLNTVKVYLHRGRKLLAQFLDEQVKEPVFKE